MRKSSVVNIFVCQFSSTIDHETAQYIGLSVRETLTKFGILKNAKIEKDQKMNRFLSSVLRPDLNGNELKYTSMYQYRLDLIRRWVQ